MNKMYKKQLDFLYDVFNRNMDEFDIIDDSYGFWDNSDPSLEGYGFKFYGKKDNFQPTIRVRCDLDEKQPSISIFVENRNGNVVINGNIVAIYSMKIDYRENMKEEELKEIDEKYRKMIKHTLDKWTCYDKQNQLGYVEEDDEEREEF